MSKMYPVSLCAFSQYDDDEYTGDSSPLYVIKYIC